MGEGSSPLVGWESFYVIVGSSGGALTGLQFVVMALVAESSIKTSSKTIEAFGTPTIVHFCSALLISAVMSAPWRGLYGAEWVLGVSGLAGVAYVAITTRRASRQTGYEPVLEDWVWHITLPLLAYALLLVAAVLLGRNTEGALFMIATTSLLLLFVGIHNAWDTVTYITIRELGRRHQAEAADG